MSPDPARAMWVWVHADAPPDPGELGALAARERVREAFVSVPWHGPTTTGACVAALRAHGVRIAALGGNPAWAEDGDGSGAGTAAAWAMRATAGGLFDSVHLDIEPWERCDWECREQVLLAGLERATGEVADAADLPVEVDVAPWIADEHPAAFAAIARRADAVTLMAYRDRAPASSRSERRRGRCCAGRALPGASASRPRGGFRRT